jgi:hypothetical protein
MQKTFGTGSSEITEACMSCKNTDLESLLFLGYLPPVNAFVPIGQKPREQPSYPAELLYCNGCDLVQMGLAVDPQIIFPPEYPYTSSTTKILRENFSQLFQESHTLLDLKREDLVVDIGSNDGNLLINYKDYHRVLGVTPEDIGKIAIERGIPTVLDYFSSAVVDDILEEHGPAKLVTATNVFAHMEHINEVTGNICRLMEDNGTFISESHYLAPLIDTCQYDTIYHEHLRYYSLHSVSHLLERHGLEVFHAGEIPTHGGSIRVYAAEKGSRQVDSTVDHILEKEKDTVANPDVLREFGKRATESKLSLYSLLDPIKKSGDTIYGIGAPSRGTTLVNYTGLEKGIIDQVVEIPGSHKIGKYIPGTLIPVTDETNLFANQPEYALLFSWHIADELMPKLREKGYRGKFIVPLPEPKIVN